MNKNICFLNSNDSTGLLGFGGSDLLRLQNYDTIENIQSFMDENSNRYIFLCLSYDLKNQIENLNSSNVDLASSSGASTSSKTQIGDGLVRNTAKIRDKAVKACSPPDNKVID